MIFYRKSIIKRIFLVASLTLFFFAAKAQPETGDDPDVPIDGGVSILLASGIAFGAKKLYDQKKLQDKSE